MTAHAVPGSGGDEDFAILALLRTRTDPARVRLRENTTLALVLLYALHRRGTQRTIPTYKNDPATLGVSGYEVNVLVRAGLCKRECTSSESRAHGGRQCWLTPSGLTRAKTEYEQQERVR